MKKLVIKLKIKKQSHIIFNNAYDNYVLEVKSKCISIKCIRIEFKQAQSTNGSIRCTEYTQIRAMRSNALVDSNRLGLNH